jgi:hypothetical protein
MENRSSPAVEVGHRAAGVRRGVQLTPILGHLIATPNASTAVLVHCGFTRTATIADPDDGVDDDVWRWELELR